MFQIWASGGGSSSCNVNTEFGGFNDAEKSGIQVQLRVLGSIKRHIELRIDDQPPQCIVNSSFRQKSTDE